MSNDKFIDGLLVKAPHEKAPEYVKAKISIQREKLISWLQAQTGDWINADIKVSQGGKWYAAIDDWKPEGQRQERAPQRAANGGGNARGGDPNEDIPFAPHERRTAA